MLKSALKLILEPMHLSYVIKDEVLKITSEQLRDRQIYAVTYSVADLVIPIPNFVPNNRMGLQGALADSYANMVVGSRVGSGAQPTALLASHDGTQASGVISPAILSQMGQMNPLNPGLNGPRTGQMPGGGFPGGPGGMSGGAQADFDSLIDLITSTIAPDTWGDAPGQGSIKEFDTNLSLVISHTQDVHDQIADLLKQLRKLQDLQVTIEVRFITLNDNFFERIGVDFQFNLQSNVTSNPANTVGPQKPSVTVGLLEPVGTNAFPNFTPDLAIPFRQGSFALSTPQFGGFAPESAANFGFAILSDLEAYFLVTAAQGDRRSNVLQAPKVTLFNGQQANVIDQTQTPFVISVIPVVGDFAVANQPVIVVLSEGTFLTVQAVVSNDKRFVRLTVVPYFSTIGPVNQFTFSGSTSTTNNTSNSGSTTGSGDNTTSSTNNATTTSDGITVQLPSLAIVSVTTTVSVPDGGTVLLGGIKRLSEGRNEFGVPILSKLPYINRLFKNVGIGRETQSLMMMVTPRIIIQEEEEDKLGIAAP
jgi:general secretion pathway protein D